MTRRLCDADDFDFLPSPPTNSLPQHFPSLHPHISYLSFLINFLSVPLSLELYGGRLKEAAKSELRKVEIEEAASKVVLTYQGRRERERGTRAQIPRYFFFLLTFLINEQSAHHLNSNVKVGKAMRGQNESSSPLSSNNSRTRTFTSTFLSVSFCVAGRTVRWA